MDGIGKGLRQIFPCSAIVIMVSWVSICTLAVFLVWEYIK